MKKVIGLESIGIYTKMPDNMNDLIDGKYVNYIMSQVAKKSVRLLMIRGELHLQIGPKSLFKVSVDVDTKKRRFILVIDDE